MRALQNFRKVGYGSIILIIWAVLLCPAYPLWAIALDPCSFVVPIPEETLLEDNLTITNTTQQDLNFTLSTREISRDIFGGLSQKMTPVELVQSGADSLVLEYNFSEPVVSREADYDTVNIKGLNSYQRIGAPIVPVRPVTILIPYGKQVTAYRVSSEQTRELPGTYQLSPGQQPYPLSYPDQMIPTEPDMAIYGQSSPWPKTQYQTVAQQSQRGYQLYLVNLFPLQYQPAACTITYTTKLRLEIDLADCNTTDLPRPSENTISSLNKTVDNPGTLNSYLSAEISPLNSDQTTLLNGTSSYQYVIITSESLEAAPGPWNFQALRAAKIASGITATIVTTEWIYNNYDGTRPDGSTDNQTRIRNFLIDAYQNWNTEYVLIGGTNAIVPARKFWVQAWSGGDTTTMPVDMYYGCVDPVACTFDYDTDGNYGEPTDGVGGGDVDLYAEIYVGRAAVENTTEVANFIRKTLTYDSTYNDYLSEISMVGEHLGFGGVAEYAKPSMEQIRLGGTYDGYSTYGFENHPQTNFYDFDTTDNLYDADGTWLKSDLINLMNNGHHVFNHLGHANYTYDMKLSTSDLSSLANSDYFFAYSQGCMPGGFDTTNCFAEVITSMEQGAFAVVMNARYGWGTYNSTDGPSQRFARQFWDAALGENMLEMGRANQDSKEDNLWDINGSCIRWCYYELNLFGDPQQQFRFEKSCDWITLDPLEGTIAPQDSCDISITFSTMGLMPGLYQAEIEIVSNDPCYPTKIVPVTMTVLLDDLQVSPLDGLDSTGMEGGPFDPNGITYTLENIGTETLNWTTEPLADWLTVSPSAGSLDPCTTIQVEVYFNANASSLDPNIYTQTLTFQNTGSGSVKSREVSLTVKPPDCFTESFSAGMTNSGLPGLMLTFSPNGTITHYEACRKNVSAFPVDPAGSTYVGLYDDDFVEVSLPYGKQVTFYGVSYDRFYIGSNGYITFGAGDDTYTAPLENHFSLPRISGIFTDLSPQDDQCISYKQLDDRMVVTFEDVQPYGDKTAQNSFQIEMFFVDESIRITWLDTQTTAASVAGLSRGNGLPPYFFAESDLSEYLICWPIGDFNRNYFVDLPDLLILADHWLLTGCAVPYWCGKTDLDLSHTVDLADWDIFAENWLTYTLFPDPCFISHWKFDEGQGNIASDSIGENPGTIFDAQWTTGKVGDYALNFDGDGDYVRTTYEGGPSAYSVCFWYNLNEDIDTSTFDGYRSMVSKTGDEVTDVNLWSIWFHVNHGICLHNENTANRYAMVDYKQPMFYQDQWHFVAATANASQGKIYFDGRLKNTSEDDFVNGAWDDSVPFDIGRPCAGHSERFFNGKIDDVRVYKRILSDSEIQQLFLENNNSDKAFWPVPANLELNVDIDTDLSWHSGKDAVSHNVYFGTTSPGQFQVNQTDNTFDPCTLDHDTTYYWRIDEVLADSSVIEGDIWSFTTFDPCAAGWWRFEEGQGDIACDSAGTSDGTIYGAQWVSGQVGDYALNFDGDEDYVRTTYEDGPAEYTVCFWYNLNEDIDTLSFNGYRALVSKTGDEYSSVNLWSIWFSTGWGLCAQHEISKNNYALVSYKPPMFYQGQWHFVAFTGSISHGKLYFDGDLKNTAYNDFTTGPWDDSVPFDIGRPYGGDPDRFFNGKIDDVRVYDRILSDEEIQQLFLENIGDKAFNPQPTDQQTNVDVDADLSWQPGKDAVSHNVYFGKTSPGEFQGNQTQTTFDPCTLDYNTTYYWRIDEVLSDSSVIEGDIWSFTSFDPCTTFIGWWQFEEGQGDIAYDSVNGNHGTIYGAQWTAGEVGDYALAFDGYDDEVDLGNDPGLKPDLPLSISAWINLSNRYSRQGIIALDNITNYYYGVWFQITPDNTLEISYGDGGTTSASHRRSKTGTTIFTQDNWYHVVAVIRGPIDMDLYVNSVNDEGTYSGSGATLAYSNESCLIGSNYISSLFFHGTIDDVRLYSRALYNSEIKQLYQNGLQSRLMVPLN